MMTFRDRLYHIIFESDTTAGKWFDILLIVSIVLSVAVVMLDSVVTITRSYKPLLVKLEWFFTILFTIEYIARIYSSRKPLKYIFSFFGLIDLLAILPTYLSILYPSGRYLLVIRVLRTLRIFRVLKLAAYLYEASYLKEALIATRRKITVFLFTVLTSVVILGSLMYVIEGPPNGFTSIPKSIYWAIVTLTTVGYGDISPQSPLGQVIASFIMILGYGIIAVPTGIVTVELSRAEHKRSRKCPRCTKDLHETDARYCAACGEKLPELTQ